ncbi:MAG: hypothetical protein ACON5A_05150 [Candidatus Comchoanobacterales bacterium]
MDKQTTLIAVVLAVLLAATGVYLLGNHYGWWGGSASSSEEQKTVIQVKELADGTKALAAKEGYKDAFKPISENLAKDVDAYNFLFDTNKAKVDAYMAAKKKADDATKALEDGKSDVDAKGKVTVTIQKADFAKYAIVSTNNKETKAINELNLADGQTDTADAATARAALKKAQDALGKEASGEGESKVEATGLYKKNDDAAAALKTADVDIDAPAKLADGSKDTDLRAYFGFGTGDNPKLKVSVLVDKYNTTSDANLVALKTALTAKSSADDKKAINDAFGKNSDDVIKMIDAEVKKLNKPEEKSPEIGYYFNTTGGYELPA